MAEKTGPNGTGSQGVQAATGKSAQADSGPAGSGSEGVYVNDQGEVCIGSRCFYMRFKPDTQEVRVKIDRNECGADLQPLIDDIVLGVSKGSPTVYETESKPK